MGISVFENKGKSVAKREKEAVIALNKAVDLFEEYGLKFNAITVRTLFVVVAHEGEGPTAISRRLNLPQPTVGRLLIRMSRSREAGGVPGVLERVGSTENMREIGYRLSDRGWEFLQRLRAVIGGESN